MNWLTNVVRPKIRNILRRETPENLWIKCPDSGQLVFYKDVEANQFVIPGSNYHMRMGAVARLKSIFDNETWFDVALPEVTADPLKFRDERKYADRIKDARAKTGLNDAIKVGYGKLEGAAVVIAVQDFDFMGGSLGMAAGEAIVRGLELAVEKKSPFIVFAASGGARMQEGILSLMQMPRTTVGVQMLREAKLPYIVVLTNPTTGGVTASYAMLGDVQIAEPGALIGFAGARVIEQTIREKLPEGFQRAEYLQRSRHGRHGGASPRSAPDAGAAVPAADEIAGAGNRLEACAAGHHAGPDRIRCGRGAGRAPRVNAPAARPLAAARRIDRAAVRAASEADRSRSRADAAAAGAARSSRTQAAAGDPCRRHQRQGFDDRLSARDPGSGRPARPRLYLALIWCGSTNAFGSAAPAAARWSATTNCVRVLEHCERANAGAPITIFEIETAAAFCLFAQHPADVVLLEVGLGGRLDATNVIDAPLATRDRAGQHGSHRISRRHPDDDRRARRPRIIKRGVPVICAEQAPEAMAVIEQQAKRMRAPLHARRAAMARQCRARAAGLSGRSRPDGSGGAKTVRPASVRQCRSGDRDAARVKAGSGSNHRRSRPASSTPNGRRGCSAWRRARWSDQAPPGCEIWLDGGHNAEGGRVVAAALGDLEERVSRPLVVIAGMMANKDAGAFLANFAGLTRHIIAVPIPGSRQCDAAGTAGRRRARSSACAWKPLSASKRRCAR